MKEGILQKTIERYSFKKYGKRYNELSKEQQDDVCIAIEELKKIHSKFEEWGLL